jgi:hypothetical protein
MEQQEQKQNSNNEYEIFEKWWRKIKKEWNWNDIFGKQIGIQNLLIQLEEKRL